MLRNTLIWSAGQLTDRSSTVGRRRLLTCVEYVAYTVWRVSLVNFDWNRDACVDTIDVTAEILASILRIAVVVSRGNEFYLKIEITRDKFRIVQRMDEWFARYHCLIEKDKMIFFL